MTLGIALLCGVLICPVEAADWSGKGEFGLIVARGNTETETINLALELARESERWRNQLDIRAMRARDQGEETASRYLLGYQSNYKLNEISYVFGALRYDRDRFSSYRYQSSFTAGYGRTLFDTDRHRLRGELGAGIRRTEDRADGSVTNNAIGRLFGEYVWTISDTSNFNNRLLVESGSSNTFAENISALTVAINSRVALKLSLAVRHNTDVDPGRKKTDTLTTANLVYNFM